MSKSTSVFCFEVGIVGREYSSTFNASSRGKAKMEYIRELDGCFPDLNFTQVRARKVGGPRTSEQFKRMAAYRGLPNVKCGDRVRVGVCAGTIVGHNASANFNVLFDADSPKHPGMTLNVHPDEMQLEVLADCLKEEKQ